MTVRNSNAKPRPPRGFTLVEVLTVIVIIGILAGLTITGSMAVRDAARKGIVITDMKQLEMALQNYKSEVGELPPNFIDRDAVMRHIRKAFPRYRPVGDAAAPANTPTDWEKFVFDVTNKNSVVNKPAEDPPVYRNYYNEDADGNPDPIISAADLNALDASGTLVFWLGGLPNPETNKPSGFHEDPSFPFKRGEPRSAPYFDFNTDRLEGFQYMQPKIKPQAPFVYFRAIRNASTGGYEYGYNNAGAFVPLSYSSGSDTCVPYLDWCHVAGDPDTEADPAVTANTRVWQSPETYQIVAAGLDGVFSGRSTLYFPYSSSGKNFNDGDFDNLASFAEGELEDGL